MPVSIGVLREVAEDEARVALPDGAYAGAGATLASREAALGAQVVVSVGWPDGAAASALDHGQALLGLLDPWNHPEELVATWCDTSRRRPVLRR